MDLCHAPFYSGAAYFGCERGGIERGLFSWVAHHGRHQLEPRINGSLEVQIASKCVCIQLALGEMSGLPVQDPHLCVIWRTGSSSASDFLKAPLMKYSLHARPRVTHLSEHRQLLHQQMSALRLPGSAFPADHHALRTARSNVYRLEWTFHITKPLNTISPSPYLTTVTIKAKMTHTAR